jgi:DNA-binding LytR/AlgR family response regulator
MIISTGAITEIRTYFNSRLLIRLKPESEEEIIVSRDWVAEFKRWLCKLPLTLISGNKL